MGELLEHERSMAAAGATLAGQAVSETQTRSALDGTRASQAALRLREGRHASELEAAARERAGVEQTRASSSADVEAARQVLALPLPDAPDELIADLAGIDAELAAGRSRGWRGRAACGRRDVSRGGRGNPTPRGSACTGAGGGSTAGGRGGADGNRRSGARSGGGAARGRGRYGARRGGRCACSRDRRRGLRAILAGDAPGRPRRGGVGGPRGRRPARGRTRGRRGSGGSARGCPPGARRGRRRGIQQGGAGAGRPFDRGWAHRRGIAPARGGRGAERPGPGARPAARRDRRARRRPRRRGGRGSVGRRVEGCGRGRPGRRHRRGGEAAWRRAARGRGSPR